MVVIKSVGWTSPDDRNAIKARGNSSAVSRTNPRGGGITAVFKGKHVPRHHLCAPETEKRQLKNN